MRKIFTAQTLRAVLAGAAGGAANGFFGSGGGLLSVPALESGGLETKKAHATSLAIMLPLSVVRRRSLRLGSERPCCQSDIQAHI